jgi:hypothetical protein
VQAQQVDPPHLHLRPHHRGSLLQARSEVVEDRIGRPANAELPAGEAPEGAVAHVVAVVAPAAAAEEVGDEKNHCL